ncbi:MAG TPA: ABC transporter permease [Solirubrobacteraceae bacterium]|nr:ABC transporter permease [Solirubrobacteraceae bacterium]
MSATTVETIPYEKLGRPIRGPEALTDDWRRFWHLTFNIARTEWKLKFYGSVLGYFWQLLRPLLMFTVLYVFFTKVGHFGTGAAAAVGGPEHFYPAMLLGSIVLFTFFAEATSGAVRSVIDNEALVRKIQFPRMVIPLSTVLLAMFNLALNLIVVFIFAFADGVRPMLSWLELPVLIGMLAVFATGLAMLLSALYVYFRDVSPIWEVITQILFYASPVIIPFDEVQQKLGPTLQHIYMVSPLATVFEQFRHAVIYHAAPRASAALGGNLGLLEPIAIVLVTFAVGFVVFNRTAPYVAENL